MRRFLIYILFHHCHCISNWIIVGYTMDTLLDRHEWCSAMAAAKRVLQVWTTKPIIGLKPHWLAKFQVPFFVIIQNTSAQKLFIFSFQKARRRRYSCIISHLRRLQSAGPSWQRLGYRTIYSQVKCSCSEFDGLIAWSNFTAICLHMSRPWRLTYATESWHICTIFY